MRVKVKSNEGKTEFVEKQGDVIGYLDGHEYVYIQEARIDDLDLEDLARWIEETYYESKPPYEVHHTWGHRVKKKNPRNKTKEFKVLSIDAWGNSEDGWEWNNWFNVGNIELSESEMDDERLTIARMIDQGFLRPGVEKKVYVNDDQYNLVIVDKETHEPIFAIEYGSHY